MDDKNHIDFDTPATLRKWPSVRNERVSNSRPYLVSEGTLDDCMACSRHAMPCPSQRSGPTVRRSSRRERICRAAQKDVGVRPVAIRARSARSDCGSRSEELGSGLINPPYKSGDETDRGQVVPSQSVVACCDTAEVL